VEPEGGAAGNGVPPERPRGPRPSPASRPIRTGAAAGPRRLLARRRQAFEQRRRFVVERIAAIDGLEHAPPRGAFYALIDARALCAARGLDDAELATALLEQEHLAVVPGSAVPIPGFIRISYASSQDELDEGLARLRRFAEAK